METESTTILDDIRLTALRQHKQLEQLLDELESAALATLAGRGEKAALKSAVELLHTRFLHHLEYEEVHLGPLLNGAQPAAAPAGEGLLSDHGEQRIRLDALRRDLTIFSDPCTLAHEAQSLVHALRTDMAVEEAKLRAL